MHIIKKSSSVEGDNLVLKKVECAFDSRNFNFGNVPSNREILILGDFNLL